ncbi:MAG: hypothetical protein RJB39_124, partial [Candidatus Parcubacteria bacterium]
MCGINGFNFRDKTLLQNMNAATSHRGPDFSGEYYADTLSLGHNLLSIRAVDDISKQPYVLDGHIILAFNGQVYNTKKLIEKLQNAGVMLDNSKIQLDTYVLYESIKKFGPSIIEEVFGMFAIAYFDTRDKNIYIYRDSSGQKNLYYYHKSNTFIFSSEIKGILEHDVDRAVDDFAVFVSTSLGYIPADKTLFAHIRKVQPSECLIYNTEKHTLKKSFITPKTADYFSGDFSDNIKKLVNEHLQSKDKISINLSGGLDSSLLLHEAHRNGYDIDSYTTSFDIPGDEKTYNEDAELARKLSADYKTTHKEIHITKKDYFDNFIESYTCIEEPNYNISLPVYLITAKTEGAQGDKKRVTLSGDGGDEIFGGYSYYLQHALIDGKIKKYTPVLYTILSFLRSKFTGSTFINNLILEERWGHMKTLSKMFARNKYSHTEFVNFIKDSFAYYKNIFCKKDPQRKDPVYTSMLLDRYYWLASENFIRSDKLYGSQSMEVRSPFAYEPFRDYVDHLVPSDMYINEQNNKLFLRKYAESVLPEYIVKRPNKTGWRA